MASGESQKNLTYSYRCGASTVSGIIAETVKVIFTSMVENALPVLKVDDYLRISEGFNEKCNFPNCFGAIDGKHVNIQVTIKII